MHSHFPVLQSLVTLTVGLTVFIILRKANEAKTQAVRIRLKVDRNFNANQISKREETP